MWFGYISRSFGLAILRGTVEGKEEVDRRRGWKTILRNGQEWTRNVLDEILDLIESVSGGFPTYFCQLN